MKKIIVLFVFILSSFLGCNREQNQISGTQEIFKAEENFNDYAQKHGIKEAFLQFADDSVVMNRSGNIIKGKSAMKAYFDKQDLRKSKLTWKPDFAEISSSGDLAYTYGKFIYTVIDSVGNSNSTEGIFHTEYCPVF